MTTFTVSTTQQQPSAEPSGKIIQVVPALFFPRLYAHFLWKPERFFEEVAAYGLTDDGQVLALVRDFGTGQLCPAESIEGFTDLFDTSDRLKYESGEDEEEDEGIPGGNGE